MHSDSTLKPPRIAFIAIVRQSFDNKKIVGAFHSGRWSVHHGALGVNVLQSSMNENTMTRWERVVYGAPVVRLQSGHSGDL